MEQDKILLILKKQRQELKKLNSKIKKIKKNDTVIEYLKLVDDYEKLLHDINETENAYLELKQADCESKGHGIWIYLSHEEDANNYWICECSNCGKVQSKYAKNWDLNFVVKPIYFLYEFPDMIFLPEQIKQDILKYKLCYQKYPHVLKREGKKQDKVITKLIKKKYKTI